jgi:poly(3-hydroxyalkanoate) depolymerase
MGARLTEVPGIGHPHRAEGSGEQPAAGRPGTVARGRPRTAADEQVRTLTVRGRVLRVAVRGWNPHGPPLVLCNGIGARLELLQPFVDAVDPRREVVRFDMPGTGGSPDPVLPYHLWTLAPLLSGLLDQLGYPQADVLGISWGGGLAQQFAMRNPARVRRLVLVATATGAMMVPGHPRVLRHMLTPRRHRDPAHAAAIAGEIYGGSMRGGASPISELLRAAAGPGPGRGYYYQLLAAAGWTSLPLLPLIPQPTLILAGDDDPLTPLANARIMRRLIPRSELRIYHGGHLDLVTEPARMAAMVEAFLAAGTGTAPASADGPAGHAPRQTTATP